MERAAYILYFLANLAPRALMFVLLIVLTRLMPMGEYGLFVLVVTTGEICDMALGNWVRVFALRSEGAGGRVRPRRLGRLVALTVGMTAVSLVFAVGSGLLRHDQGFAFALAVSAYLLAFAPLRLSLILLQIRRMHRTYAAVEALRAAGTLAAASAATLLAGPGFLAATLGLAGATLLAGLVGLVRAMRGVARPQRARTGYGAAIAFGLPVMLASLLAYTIGIVDRYAVDLLMGPHAVAVLAAAYSLARQPVDLFLGPLNAYAFPHLVRLYEQEGAAATGRAQAGLIATLTIVGGAIVSGLSLLAVPLLAVALPADYREEGAVLIPWIAVGSLAIATKFFIFDNAFHLSKRTWLQPPAMTPPALFGILLCFLLIPRLGILGAGISYALASLAACTLTALITRRIIPIPMPWRALARVAAANLGGCLALVAVRGALDPFGPVAVLVGGTLAFVAVYAGLLHLFGIAVRRVVETPWAPLGAGGRAGPGLTPALAKS
ncbi:lipopolysaccharide biosynthesis protein [uncultured Methylobacterium sp.]|jgi:O-antigen/teichoic acid export membrane protein|uniref:lipopolysaccharide biosynthesis protein n=1 Tax=uncultured Methylobacterium sp. TaxID=157278 RepID=UPI0026240936|nr:lipopolysaccharide biosynthesis protein [uncultured Methylobacterium sp.]